MEINHTTPLQNEHTSEDLSMSAEQVCAFLQKNPYFFEQNASLLADIHLPSPHGSGTISLTERQQLAQRDKIRVLEVKLAQLIEYAEENDVTSTKVHALSLALLKNRDLTTLQNDISAHFQKHFEVSQVILRIWQKPMDAAMADEVIFDAVDDALSDWTMALKAPYCGAKPEVVAALLHSEAQSCCIIPLKGQLVAKPFGVLMLGANSAQRFKSGMGTHYLNRMGEMISAALLPQI